jgi:N-acetylmuramoyl-L-alanine amidase|tara:strand:- start:219 stop:677 length:459 start_codon:yes stop_codon:yes gene_type:complete
MKSLWMIILTFVLIVCASAVAEEKDSDIVAMTILGEARGEGKAGMYAVACVIAQRSIEWKRNGKSITPKQVCLQDWQFSCWNKDDPNRNKLPILLKTHQHAAYAKMLASNLNNLQRSYVNNADHYCHVNTHRKWTRGNTIKVIGKHKFYKLR